MEVLYFLGVVSLQLACLDVLRQRECALFLLVELGRSQGKKQILNPLTMPPEKEILKC